MKYFWLEKHLQQWQAAINNNHKPQAVIIDGASGIGKSALMHQILADLVCRKQAQGYCGECQNCILQKQGHHPDVHNVEPEKNVVKVKMIRQLTDFFHSTPHCCDYKIAVIYQAESMNAAAANALLKVLEEPPSRGILFLITNSKHRLMPTIKSRCIGLDVNLTGSEKDSLKTWLQELSDCKQETAMDALILSDYQPISALNLLKDNQLQAFQVQLDGLYAVFNAEESISVGAKQLIENQHHDSWALLQRYFMQLLKSELNQQHHKIYASHPLTDMIKKTPKVIHIIIKITDLIQQFMLNLNTQIKLQLMLESILAEIKNEFKHGVN